MEKVRPWCGQPSDQGRLKNRTEWYRTSRVCAVGVSTPCRLLALQRKLKRDLNLPTAGGHCSPASPARCAHMPPIAARVASSVVRVFVCWTHGPRVLQKRSCRFKESDSCRSRNHALVGGGVQIPPPREGTLLRGIHARTPVPFHNGLV